LKAAEEEAEKVATRFKELNDGELAGLIKIRIHKLIGGRITVNDIRDLLRQGRFDIVHYAGHAHFDKADPEGSAWLMSDGFLRAQEIRNTLAWTETPPWLVYANACEAGMDAEGPTSRYQGDVFGLATAFINQGVSAYIAPLWPVQDEVAAKLATDFYEALLLDRLSLGEALRRGKIALKQDLLAEGDDQEPLPSSIALSWASTVLYGDPTSRLLRSLWTPAGS
jgi:CHAT domain-containing protein